MKWQTAVDLARACGDVTYQEWCWLYYNHKQPTQAQIEKATKTAHSILVRNNIIEESVTFLR